MTDFLKDMTRIQELVGNSFTATGGLVALADGGAMPEAKLQQTLEKTLGEFESSVLELRLLCERYSPGAGSYGRRPVLPACAVSGHVEKIGYNWLHIQLNTLLPHCRYQSPAWLTDTIRRLLDGYEATGERLPFFNKALLVIEECAELPGRHVFDPDNKGWKSVCNALKGRVIPDDDQYTLGLVLLASQRAENACHITLMDLTDAADFFAFHSGDYAVENIYESSFP